MTGQPGAACGVPLKLEARLVERVWGEFDLGSVYPDHHRDGKRIGEVWLTGDENKVASGPHSGPMPGPFAGKTIGEITRNFSAGLLGAQTRPHPSGRPVFPLLVKFLFTTDKLSVQLHPSDTAAAAQRSWGKTEMWHVLRAEPGASLAVGFCAEARDKLRANPQALRDAISSGAIEQMLDWRVVHAGETYFVPAGTVHAIGAGLTICEIQQNSDITYRLYDYHRPGTDGQPRALHVDQGLEVMSWETPSGLTRPVEMSLPPMERRLLAACPLFATERCEVRAPQVHLTENRMEIWVGLEGALEMHGGDIAAARAGQASEMGETLRMGPGEAVLLPADLPWVKIAPQPPDSTAVLLRCYIPNFENSLVEALRVRGVPADHLRRVCFPL